MLAYGAEFELTPREKGMKGAIARAEELVAATPDSWMPQQFENPANVEVHRRTTAQEILADFPDAPIDVLITGVGTGGHITGLRRGAQEGVAEPARSSRSSRRSRPSSPAASRPAPDPGHRRRLHSRHLDTSLLDGVIQVDADDAKEMARRCGPRGRHAGRHLLRRDARGDRAETAANSAEKPRVLGFNYDTGERYLSVPDFLPEEG